tara:strand:+ start:336 stop:725 length:390 start_codon:yes stop_codon:yes gene_type:complete
MMIEHDRNKNKQTKLERAGEQTMQFQSFDYAGRPLTVKATKLDANGEPLDGAVFDSNGRVWIKPGDECIYFDSEGVDWMVKVVGMNCLDGTIIVEVDAEFHETHQWEARIHASSLWIEMDDELELVEVK